MKLFSEEVKPTYTSSVHNILRVESLEEVFFDVFEFEINGSTFIAEKLTTYKGNPVVNIPVEVGNTQYNAQFILSKGPQEILLNNKTFNKQTVNENTPQSSGIFEESIIHEIDEARISSHKLEEQQQEAKIKKLVESLELKESKVNDIISDARKSFVEEFLNVAENTKLELYETNIQLEDNLKDKLKIYIKESLNDHSDELTTSVKKEHNKSVDLLKENLKELTDEIYTSTLIKLVEDKDKKNKESFNLLQENLDLKIDDLNEDINLRFKQLDAEVISISKAKVDIHNELNKSFNKTLSRVGNVKKGLEDTLDSSMKYIEEALESKFTKAEQSARSYFDTKLEVIEESFSGEESKVKAYIFDLIKENKEDLLSKFANYQNEAATVIEQYGDKNVKIDPKKIQDDIQTNLTNTFQQQIMTLRRAVDTYGGGGGSVAKQFAAGGTMDGNLTVNGEINADKIYATTLLSAGTINYEFELSGFSVTGDISANGDITANQLSAVGTSPNYFGGNVGIGTTSPGEKLHVQEGSSTKGATIRIDNPTTTNNSCAGIEFINSSTGIPRSAIMAQRVDSGYNPELVFYTSDSNSLQERMRIDHDGCIGIGTTSPNSLLNVQGDSDPTILINAETGNSANSGKLAFAETDGGAHQAFIKYDGSANRLEIGTADVSQALVVNRTDGNVGIGTPAPAEKLTVAGNISASGSLSAAGPSSNYFQGNVGIGTNTAPQKLTVRGGLTHTNSLGIQVVTMTNASDAGRLIVNQAGGVTRVLLNSDGDSYFNSDNVGIGTTSPACKLTVAGVISATGLKGVSSINLEAAGPIITACSTNNASGLRINVTGLDADNDDLLRVQDNGATRLCVERDGKIFGCTASLTGLSLADNYYACFGSGADLKIRHNGTDSSIANTCGDLYIQNEKDDKSIIFRGDSGGSVAEYFRVDGLNSVNKFCKNLQILDGVEAMFGNGSDLKISHDGTNSGVTNYLGDFYISNFADGKDIIFRADDGDGGYEEYFRLDSSLNTAGNPYTVFPDNARLSLGAGADLSLFHNGTNSSIENTTGNLNIINYADDKNINFQTDNLSGGVTDYFTIDGNNGLLNHHKPTLNADGVYSYFGSGYDLSIWHDGTNSNIRNTTNDLYIANYQDAGDILIQSDDGTGGVANYLQFDGGGTLIRAYKNIRAQDDVFLQAGSSGDLELVHTANHSYINNKTGDLYITNSVDTCDVFLRTDNGSGGVCNYIQLDGGSISTNLLTTKVNMPNLPTSDPGVAGDLWRDGTDLKISVG